MTGLQRWEYCEVDDGGTIIFYGADQRYRADEPPAEVPGNDGDRRERVAWLGMQGWELVAVVRSFGDEHVPVTTFYLKRPLDEPAVEENGHAAAEVAVPAAEPIEEMPVIAVGDVDEEATA